MKASTASSTADLDEIRRALALLVESAAAVELRIPAPRGVASGYFDNLDALATEAARWSGRVEGVYVTLNPVAPSLLARSPNVVTERAKHTTADRDVVRRARLLVDLDPVRPAGISSSDDEHVAAIERAQAIRAWLLERGWPAPLVADSGNGAHLVCALALENDAASGELARRALEALALDFSDARVAVDTTTHNAGRICKVYGTLAAKGADTSERPHRLARILEAPGRLEVVPRELLEALAAMAPPTPQRAGTSSGGAERALDARGLAITKRKAWSGGTLLELAECPWAGPTHSRTARVILHATGAVSAGCFHASCSERGWRDLREVLGMSPPPSNGHGGRLETEAACASVWDAAVSVPEFLDQSDEHVDFLEPRLLVRGAITELFAPRGLGKTQVAYAVGVRQARAGRRVLLVDRDNPRHEIRRRLARWDGRHAHTFKVIGRDRAPALTDAGAWRAFPLDTYDVVMIDSIDAATEGVGEGDSAKPSSALAQVLDLARRADGPAILVLGNVIKSGAHSRGCGVVEDRADVVYEVRDATDLKPTGTKDWWCELPAAGVGAWAERASRRKRRDVYRLAFIATKFRLGEEPEPFVLEIDHRTEPWELRDVTTDLIAAGESAREARAAEERQTMDQAIEALVAEIERRHAATEPALTKGEAVAYLQGHGMKQRLAREAIDEGDGTRWTLAELPAKGRGKPRMVTVCVLSSLSSTSESSERLSCTTEEVQRERPHEQRPGEPFHSSPQFSRADERNPIADPHKQRGSETPLLPPLPHATGPENDADERTAEEQPREEWIE